MNYDVDVKVSGPLFQAGAPAVIRAAAQSAVAELVQLGEQRLDATLRPRPAGVYLSVEQAQKRKASTGHYRRSLHAVVKDLHGRIADGNVVYGPWLEGISSRNQSTRFKGYASFRRTAQWLQKQARKVMEAHVRRLRGRLG